MEPGPGQWDVIDVNNRVTVASDFLQFAAAASAVDSGVVSVASLMNPSQGMVCMFRSRITAGITQYLGVQTAANFSSGSRIARFETSNTDRIYIRVTGAAQGEFIVGFSQGSTFRNYSIIHTGGSRFFFTVDDRLVLTYELAPVATGHPTAAVFHTTTVCDTEYVRGARPSDNGWTDWESDYAIATNRIPVSSNGETTTAEADALIEHRITAATGVTQELMVRRIDDNNCIIVRMDQVAGTIATIKKEAGVETPLDSDAQTWVNGTDYIVRCHVIGSYIRTYVHIAATASPMNKNVVVNTYNQTETGVKVSHAGTELITWPHVLPASAYAALQQLDAG
jgi:hypothetical protein